MAGEPVGDTVPPDVCEPAGDAPAGSAAAAAGVVGGGPFAPAADLPKRNRIGRFVLTLLVALAVMLSATRLFVDLDRVWAELRVFPPVMLAGIVAAVLGNYLLRFLKWTWFLRAVGAEVPWRASATVFVSAFTMTLSPGKLGELMKAWQLRDRFGIPLAKTTMVVLAERVTDLLGLIVLAAIGASRFGHGVATIGGSLLLVLAGVLVITRPGFFSWLDTAVLARSARLARLRPPLRSMAEATRGLLSLRGLAWSVPLSAVSWGGEGVALYLIFRGLSVSVPDLFLASVFAHAFSSIVGALSFVPGGLFVTEGALGVFFVSVGIDRAPAVVATLLIRMVTLWFAVGLGTVVFSLSGWHEPRVLPAADSAPGDAGAGVDRVAR